MNSKAPGEELEKTARELAAIKYALDQAAIVAITDRAGRITHVNEKFCQISKYDRSELLGQNHRIIKSGIHASVFFRDMWATISSGKVWEGEICNRAKDGSLYWVNTCIVPFLDTEGIPYQYVSIRYEITQRKTAETQMAIYAKKLEQSNQELEHFASIAAHDLQEPLRKIRSFSERLANKIKDSLAPDSADYLKRIVTASVRMQTLIDDLLAYSRVRLNQTPFGSVDLNQTLKDVIADLELQIDQSGATISIDPLPTIEADALLMRQLFQNLLSNALKFRAAERILEIKVSASDSARSDAWVFSVKDNGIGFEEKYLDRIFEIFQRLHGRSEYPGTGVGLAICRRIVDRHHGSITAKGSLGEGSEFLVSLPKTPSKSEPRS